MFGVILLLFFDPTTANVMLNSGAVACLRFLQQYSLAPSRFPAARLIFPVPRVNSIVILPSFNSCISTSPAETGFRWGENEKAGAAWSCSARGRLEVTPGLSRRWGLSERRLAAHTHLEPFVCPPDQLPLRLKPCPALTAIELETPVWDNYPRPCLVLMQVAWKRKIGGRLAPLEASLCASQVDVWHSQPC